MSGYVRAAPTYGLRKYLRYKDKEKKKKKVKKEKQ